MSPPALALQPLSSRAARNFFTHSGHIPLVMLILEALLAPTGYFRESDPYLLVAAGIAQAWIAEAWAGTRGWRIFVANLSGPALYTAAESALEGRAFFALLHHQAYWAFGLAFGLLQAAQPRSRALLALRTLAENVLRSCIPLVMYAVFEARADHAVLSWRVFFDDPAHRFLAVMLPLLGLLLGFAELNLRRSLATIAALGARLRQYSEWALGPGLLERAISDEQVLSLQRIERAVVFMDIRGFTAWSETQAPEAVVRLLSSYYAGAERALADADAVKLKYTADEVMAVFASSGTAIAAARRMLAAAHEVLSPHGLGAGAGVNAGPVMEGVLGGEGAKAYDFIGDTVNAAQRLCDAAAHGELLAAHAACLAADQPPADWRDVAAKGKREPLRAGVYPASATA